MAESGLETSGTPASAENAAAPQWYAGFDRETQGYLQNKGWTHAQGPGELVKAYRSLERMNGVERLPMPKDASDVEGWNRTYDRLGRPKSWQDYGIEIPEDGRDYADRMLQAFHQAGLSTKQAQMIAAESDRYLAAAQAEGDQQFANQSLADLDAVRREWGREADRKFAAGQRAGLAFGIERPTMEKIERAIGTREFLSLMARIGEGLTEDRGAGANASGFMTPEAAQARLNDLKSDQGWVKRYLSGDSNARADYDRLISVVAAG